MGASAALFGERIDPWFWAGTALVLTGIALNTGARTRASAASTAGAVGHE